MHPPISVLKHHQKAGDQADATLMARLTAYHHLERHDGYDFGRKTPTARYAVEAQIAAQLQLFPGTI
jgi:hypothetical protein